MNYFLLVYDRAEGQVTNARVYTDQDRAIEESLVLERAAITDDDLEVVVLGAESFGALLRTHSRYFAPPARLAAHLAAVSPEAEVVPDVSDAVMHDLEFALA